MRHQILYKKSKYKYVAGFCYEDNTWLWQIRLPNITKKCYKTEIEAAKAVDMYLISKGKKPLNILKKL